MKITFCSNFLNHHQIPFSLEMIKRPNIEYKFIATEKIPEERIKLGYETMNDKYSFVIKAYEEPEEALKVCNESDVVIIGSAPDIYIKDRLEKNKLTFRYSERVFKKGRYRVISPRGLLYLKKNHTRYKNKNLYMLCASAYCAKDFSLVGAYKEKCYKWGYFPEYKKYDNIEKILENKNNNSTINIIWVARLIKLKHPELVIALAKKLRKKNYNFKITMIGEGKLYKKIESKIIKEELQNNISLIGSINHYEVRKYMENADVFLFTSDQNEGWGAVLNEAMNSGCAVVANKKIGSVPYLIKENYNGLVYNNKNEIIKKVELLINSKEKREEMGKNAYFTISKIWNAENAVNNLLRLIETLQNNMHIEIKEGPCSVDNEML